MEMSEEKIKIKGENGGLSLAFPPAMPFSEIMEELGKKLDSGAGFFLRGTLVRVPRDLFSKQELAELQELFRTHGLICRQEKPKPAPLPPQMAADVQAPAVQESEELELRQMLVIEKTLRGGQAVETEGSVIVFGNVKPDAVARSLRVVRTTSGSAMALRPALVMGRPSGDAAEAQCQRRVRRDRMRTITGAHQCRCHHSPFLGQGQDPSRMRTGPAATPATDPGIEGWGANATSRRRRPCRQQDQDSPQEPRPGHWLTAPLAQRCLRHWPRCTASSEYRWRLGRRRWSRFHQW